MNTDRTKNDRRSWRDAPRMVVGFFGRVLMRLCFVALLALVLAVVAMWLWNLLMPQIFGLAVITYWQAFGLMILARLLIGFGVHPRSYHRRDRTHPGDWSRMCGPSARPGAHFDRTMKWWGHYKQFWRDEGKAAFDEYMKRAEKEGTKKEPDKS